MDRNQPSADKNSHKVKIEEKHSEPKKTVNIGREVKKLETQIAQLEEEITALRELRFDPEYYHDYQKMQELDDKIDDVNNEIENRMALWETYSEQLG